MSLQLLRSLMCNFMYVNNYCHPRQNEHRDVVPEATVFDDIKTTLNPRHS